MYSLWQDLSVCTKSFDPFTLTFDLLLKKKILNLGYNLHLIRSLYLNFVPKEIKLSFLASRDECPGSLCHSPSVGVRVGCVDKNFNLSHNFQTRRSRALILHMCIP